MMYHGKSGRYITGNGGAEYHKYEKGELNFKKSVKIDSYQTEKLEFGFLMTTGHPGQGGFHSAVFFGATFNPHVGQPWIKLEGGPITFFTDTGFGVGDVRHAGSNNPALFKVFENGAEHNAPPPLRHLHFRAERLSDSRNDKRFVLWVWITSPPSPPRMVGNCVIVENPTRTRHTSCLGANLTRADLIGANLTDANLTNADLRGAKLNNAYLNGANLAGANLAGAYLAGANLTDAYLRGADLKDAFGTYYTRFCNTTMPDGSKNNSNC